jgi:plastocyanin
MFVLRLCLAMALGGLATTVSAANTHPVHLSAGSEISGHVELVANPGQALAPGEVTDTLVYFVPKSGKPKVHPGTYTVYSVDQDFRPAAMAIPAGSTVKFANLDQVLHNLYSSTPGSVFNYQFQKVGEVLSHRFTQPGPVLVSCNVHHFMELDLLVVPTPYMAAVAADGSFVLHGLPAGPGTLYVWNPRGALKSQPVGAPEKDVSMQLVAIKPRVATELNQDAQR